jgi:LacI family transcriptional regulator
MKSGGKATITDVARLAGVSIKSVSRVINKEPNVREKLREQVMRAAKELDYRPNFSARSLAGMRSFLIGYLFGDPSGDYAHRVEIGILNRCREAGYHLMVEQIDVTAPDVAARTAALVTQLRLDGVVLTPPITDFPDVLRVLRDAGVPYVRIAPDKDLDGSPIVAMDDAAAAQQLTEHLIALGHRQIGFIKGDPGHSAARLRYEGYCRALAAHGIKLQPRLVAQGLFSYASGLDCARTLLLQAKRPTAIFASNDDMAAAVIAVAHENGLRLPAELSVVGFDDAPIAGVVWPPLTTVRQPIAQMAEAAADILLSLSGHKDAGTAASTASRRDLEYEIKLRQSTAPPPA